MSQSIIYFVRCVWSPDFSAQKAENGVSAISATHDPISLSSLIHTSASMASRTRSPKYQDTSYFLPITITPARHQLPFSYMIRFSITDSRSSTGTGSTVMAVQSQEVHRPNINHHKYKSTVAVALILELSFSSVIHKASSSCPSRQKNQSTWFLTLFQSSVQKRLVVWQSRRWF